VSLQLTQQGRIDLFALLSYRKIGKDLQVVDVFNVTRDDDRDSDQRSEAVGVGFLTNIATEVRLPGKDSIE
jgi:hypothetical protein